MQSGYLSETYTRSLSYLGAALELKHSRSWIRNRPILNTSCFDGMGTYPVFACNDWSKLEEDFNDVSDQIICLSLVTDPFGSYQDAQLQKIFSDVCTPYKEHFVVDLNKPINSYIDPHHLRNVKKSLKINRIEHVDNPMDYFEDWCRLYNSLTKRHNIKGITEFSKSSFEHQLRVPGINMFRAVHNEETVGLLLWYVQGEVAYYHLGA